MYLEIEFEELDTQFDLEFEQITEVSDGGYDRGYGDAMEETEVEATIQEDLLSQVSSVLERKVTGYERGKKEGFAEALSNRTDLVVTENGEYTPSEDSTGFKSVSVNVQFENKLAQVASGTLTELKAEDLKGATKISAPLFRYNYNLLSAEIAEGIVSIANEVFYQCLYLKTITLPSSLQQMAYSVFYSCRELTTIKAKSTTPPTIQNNTFQYCNAISKIAVPIGSGDAYKSATNWSAFADIIVEEDV